MAVSPAPIGTRTTPSTLCAAAGLTDGNYWANWTAASSDANLMPAIVSLPISHARTSVAAHHSATEWVRWLLQYRYTPSRSRSVQHSSNLYSYPHTSTAVLHHLRSPSVYHAAYRTTSCTRAPLCFCCSYLICRPVAMHLPTAMRVGGMHQTRSKPEIGWCASFAFYIYDLVFLCVPIPRPQSFGCSGRSGDAAGGRILLGYPKLPAPTSAGVSV